MTLSSPTLRTQIEAVSGSISMATSKWKSTSSPRSLATRSMVLTRETLLTCMGQAASAAIACRGRQFQGSVVGRVGKARRHSTLGFLIDRIARLIVKQCAPLWTHFDASALDAIAQW